jgi:hypothetical protein
MEACVYIKLFDINSSAINDSSKDNIFGIYHISGTLCLLQYFIKQCKKTIKQFLSFRNILLMLMLLGGIIYFISTNELIINILTSYYESSSTALTKAVLTAAGVADEKNTDASALGRVGNLDFLKVFYMESRIH